MGVLPPVKVGLCPEHLQVKGIASPLLFQGLFRLAKVSAFFEGPTQANGVSHLGVRIDFAPLQLLQRHDGLGPHAFAYVESRESVEGFEIPRTQFEDPPVGRLGPLGVGQMQIVDRAQFEEDPAQLFSTLP